MSVVLQRAFAEEVAPAEGEAGVNENEAGEQAEDALIGSSVTLSFIVLFWQGLEAFPRGIDPEELGVVELGVVVMCDDSLHICGA